MFATLVFPTGAPVATVIADICSVLCGSDVSSLSSSANKTISTVDNSKGGPATWQFVADSVSLADVSNTPTSINLYSAKVLKQKASTSFGNQDKYLKIVAFNATPGIVVGGMLGKGVTTGGILTGAQRADTASYYATVNAVGRTTSAYPNAFGYPVKVQIYSTDSVTLINIAEGDLFSYRLVLAVFDFKNTTPDLNTQGNICTVIHSTYDDISGIGGYITPRVGSKFLMPETNVDGKVWNIISAVCIGTPDIFEVTKYLASSTEYKYSGFSKVGTTYDLYNVGVTAYRFTATSGYFREQIPYASITDVTSVYMIHKLAFGNNGDFFETPKGVMCKFGMFMVEV